MGRMRLPWDIKLRVMWRSFLLQASWNFECMQSLGLVYVLGPALQYLYRDEELQAAYQRHLSYFNTHPFMASPVIGVLLSLEEKQANGEASALSADDFKRMVMAPYAAIGDALFWGGFRILAAVVTLFFCIKGFLWAPLVFLLLFNLPHLWLRLIGFWRGYEVGLRVVDIIQKHRLPDIAILCKEGAVVLAGGLCAYLVVNCLKTEQIPVIWGLLAIPVMLLLGWLSRRGISTLLLGLFCAALLILLPAVFS